MVRERRYTFVQVGACVLALGLAEVLRRAVGADPAWVVAFGFGMLLAFVEVVRIAASPSVRPKIGPLERIAVRVAGGGLAVLALVAVQAMRHADFAGSAAPYHGVQDVAAAVLASSLLMRLPLFVALGNEPLLACPDPIAHRGASWIASTRSRAGVQAVHSCRPTNSNDS